MVFNCTFNWQRHIIALLCNLSLCCSSMVFSFQYEILLLLICVSLCFSHLKGKKKKVDPVSSFPWEFFGWASLYYACIFKIFFLWRRALHFCYLLLACFSLEFYLIIFSLWMLQLILLGFSLCFYTVVLGTNIIVIVSI